MPPIDLTTKMIAVLVTNPSGALYRAVLDPGALTPLSNGTIFWFRDLAARTGEGNPHGIYSVKLRQHRHNSGYTIRVEAYADLKAATDPRMRIQFYVGDAVFITTDAPWTRLPRGWRAPKDH